MMGRGGGRDADAPSGLAQGEPVDAALEYDFFRRRNKLLAQVAMMISGFRPAAVFRFYLDTVQMTAYLT